MSAYDPDFMKQYQGFARQAWDAWSRSLQPPAATPSFFAPPPSQPTVEETLERSLSGFRGYLEWLQSAVGNGVGQGADWQQQLQALFGAGQPAFAQAFAGIGSPSVQGLGEQWQRWMQAAQPAGFGDLRATLQSPAFGYKREQQEQQQALQRAMLDHAEASGRYQQLMLRAQLEGADRLQKRLAERSQASQPVESLKSLYDLWIDCAEEAYAEIALSDEFRQVYGAQVNTQMRVRKLQKQQMEAWCQELGLPTASEVASLGERLQQLRREVRELRKARAADTPPVAARPASASAPVTSRATRTDGNKATARKGGARKTAASKTAPRKAAAKTPAKATTKSSTRSAPRSRR